MRRHDAEVLARNLIAQHLPGHGWRFVWLRARRKFGHCDHRHHEIGLSLILTTLNDESHVRDTILHEIAHAKAGCQAGHGRLWKAHALSIGANPARTYGTEVSRPEGRWVMKCPTCLVRIPRYRRPRAGAIYRCVACRKRGVDSIVTCEKNA